MRGRGDGWRGVVVAAGLLIVVGLLVWMFAVWRGKDGLQTSANVAQLVGVLLAVPTLVVKLVLWWRQRGPAPVADAETVALAKDALAVMVAAQWREEARIRELDDPAPIPVRWELTTDQRIMDHPAHITADDALAWSGTADQIGAMAGRFRALRRRRLVIIGGPGSGKTTLAVQLVRELLEHPEPDEPVPVLVSVADWDTERFPRLQGWLTARLRETYPSLRAPQYGPDAADQLVQRAHILPVLDGLDEIPAQTRAAVIAALNRSLADHDQLILTSRTREFTDAALARDVLTSAAVIQPQPVTADAAADYLASCLPPVPSPAWADTLHKIRTGRAPHLTEVVSAPLGLWLLRTTHITTRTDPAPLTDPARFPTPQSLRTHFFDQLIPALIDARPPSADPAVLFRPRRRHDPVQATRWLGYLAHLLDTVPTRDLAWWRLAAITDPPNVRLNKLAFRLVGGLVFGLVGGLATGLRVGAGAGPVVGIAVGLLVGLVSGYMLAVMVEFVIELVGGLAVVLYAHWWAPDTPGYANLKTTGGRLLLVKRLAGGLVLGLVGGSVGGLVFGLATGLADELRSGPEPGLGPRLVFGIAAGLVIGATYGLVGRLIAWVETPAASGHANTPIATWRVDRALNLLRICTVGGGFGLVSGLVGGTFGGVAFGTGGGLASGLGFGLLGGLVGGLGFGRRHAWLAYLVVTFWSARRRLLPRSLMAFLDDAHRLGLLRTVGPVYQFRHAEFHDHLAAVHTASQEH
ncbi:NACHT domain-containing protein [Actinomadura terrae]|uniref:NACHT domain-containing protein n=1 Tax=Actinomadura terrae TaxID=604353 RepID=UPI001FA8032F|nr:NACHT domain-containing protein [Actinomadura terrae]